MSYDIKTSGSSYATFMRCPLRWCYEYVSNRVPRISSVPLEVGKLVHRAFEHHFKTGEPLDSAMLAIIASTNPSTLNEKEKEAYSYCADLVEPLASWQELFPIDATLEIEEPYEFPLPTGQIYQMTPDRVVVVWGKAVHMQHKTIDKSKNIGTFIMGARRSVHEHMYAVGLARKYPEYQYGGTIYNIVRKLKYRTSVHTKKEIEAGLPPKILNKPESMFFQAPIGVSKPLQSQTVMDVMLVGQQMQRVADRYRAGKWIPSSHDLDLGIYGNSPDPYLPVILGEASLFDDTLFMDREERYLMEGKKPRD